MAGSIWNKVTWSVCRFDPLVPSELPARIRNEHSPEENNRIQPLNLSSECWWWSHLGPIPILSIPMLLLRLCYPQTSNLFPPGLRCQPAYSPPPVSLCSIEPQTTSLPTQSGWPGAWSASLPTGRTSPYHSLSRPSQSDPSPGQAWVCPLCFTGL